MILFDIYLSKINMVVVDQLNYIMNNKTLNITYIKNIAGGAFYSYLAPTTTLQHNRKASSEMSGEAFFVSIPRTFNYITYSIWLNTWCYMVIIIILFNDRRCGAKIKRDSVKGSQLQLVA